MKRWYHISGIAGAGMNPLARLLAAHGHTVQGSDRGIDAGHNSEIAALLKADGITLVPQDGSGIHEKLDMVAHSTAVEESTPEMQACLQKGVQRQTRPQLLAEIINAGDPGIAIAGTSGKSTVTGMLAWILKQSQQPASILGGAALAEDGATHMGCFAAGPADAPVVAEACESDGTLVGYRPSIGFIHNITRDHDEMESLRQQFTTFATGCKQLFVNAACPESLAIAHSHPNACSYGSNENADIHLEVVRTGPWRGQGTLSFPDGDDIFLDIPQPGLHNLENAAAAAVCAEHIGISRTDICQALACFPGVARRYQHIGESVDGITVIDDYAHNADKIRAAITTAQEGCDRLVAVFQPHGFGPTRFLRPELQELLPRILRPHDKFCYAGIYYAGGTVAKDISAAHLAEDLAEQRQCDYAADHHAVCAWVCETAIPGDTVLLMGARDPSLPQLAKAIHGLL